MLGWHENVRHAGTARGSQAHNDVLTTRSTHPTPQYLNPMYHCNQRHSLSAALYHRAFARYRSARRLGTGRSAAEGKQSTRRGTSLPTPRTMQRDTALQISRTMQCCALRPRGRQKHAALPAAGSQLRGSPLLPSSCAALPATGPELRCRPLLRSSSAVLPATGPELCSRPLLHSPAAASPLLRWRPAGGSPSLHSLASAVHARPSSSAAAHRDRAHLSTNTAARQEQAQRAKSTAARSARLPVDGVTCRDHVQCTKSTAARNARLPVNGVTCRAPLLSRRAALAAALALGGGVAQPAAASKLGAGADSAWEAIGGGPPDLIFPEQFLGLWQVRAETYLLLFFSSFG